MVLGVGVLGFRGGVENLLSRPLVFTRKAAVGDSRISLLAGRTGGAVPGIAMISFEVTAPATLLHH